MRIQDVALPKLPPAGGFFAVNGAAVALLRNQSDHISPGNAKPPIRSISRRGMPSQSRTSRPRIDSMSGLRKIASGHELESYTFRRRLIIPIENVERQSRPLWQNCFK